MPEIFLIQETKMEDTLLLQTSKSFWRKGLGRAVSARGASGGIASFWDSSKYDLTQEESCQHWIFTQLLHKDSGQQVSIFNLYALVLPSEKKICWDSLQSFLLLHNPENIIIIGDLNVTLAAEEKKGGSPIRDPSREWVEDIIIGWDLEDIKPSAGKYTWSNKRLGPSHIASRLDRFLVQSSFLTSGLMASSKILPNCTSDHKPISLELSMDGFLGPIPFRFSPLWIQQEGFNEVVAEVWNRKIQGSPFFVWEEKLRALKRRLKEWAKALKTPIAKRKESIENLAALQSLMENSVITQSLLQKEVELQKALHKASRDEEEYWRQKSRNLWLQAGDKNTSFFHKHAEARKQFKNVSEIRIQDTVVNDFEGIKRAAFSFFKDLYSAPDDQPIDPQAYSYNLIPSCVHDPINNMLTAPISMDELKKALDCMESDKAPGPDGFTARFFQSCWSIINKDLLRMVRKSQVCTKIGGSTNSAFLALLPKEKGASDFSRFRPILLCNTSYKLITKIISIRLKNIFPDIIPENQGGFIKGRKILDNIVLVQEAVHSSGQRKEKGMVIKLDLANAFDRVRHDFLFAVMTKMSFSTNFTNWVKACTASPWIAPLVNGRSTEFFTASRGLRQGCPLSPLLYAIQASVLSFHLDFCQQIQILPGLRMVQNVKEINHAQFADDTLLLGGASINSASSFKKELDIYKEASGSKINYSKSTIYGWNCSAKILADIARLPEMKICQDWESFKYLGIPIFRSIPKVSHWTPLLDKLKLRIHAWGASWLNTAGKIILIKSVLTSMPLFQHSILLAPKTFLSKMDGKISWSKKVLWKKYFQGQRLRCLDLPKKNSKGSPISKLCIVALDNFSSNLYWIPGNGTKIRIWKDQILGVQPLQHIKDLANIKLWLHSNNKETLWDISNWTKDADRRWDSWNLGEVPHYLQSEASLLLDNLQGKSPLSATAKNKRGWGSHTDFFSVAEGYKSLIVVLNVPPDPMQWKFIWSFPSLPKIDFFCWMLAHNSILTGDNLRKRGMEGPSRCPLCISEEETADHLLLLCPFAKAVWKGVLSSRVDKIELPRNVPTLLHEWAKLSPFYLNKKNLLKTAWMWTPKYICWKLWLERNNRIFRGEICTSNNIISKIKAILGETLEAKPALRNEAKLDNEEGQWLKDFVPNNQSIPTTLATCHAGWEIRLEEQEFLKWRSALEDHCLFFDGASKGNPGAAGGGGVLLNPDGSTLLRYHWGLGIESNNRAEALALWQGLTLALKWNIQSLTVFGDSQLIIQAMKSSSNQLQIHLG
eukprot:PITA_24961